MAVKKSGLGKGLGALIPEAAAAEKPATKKEVEKSEEISAEYTDATKKSGMTLKVNQKVETQAEAEKLAKKKLREKNKEEVKVSLTLIGNFIYLAGNVIELVNHGFYSGRLIIEKSTHKISSSGYEVTVDCRKCLDF